MREIALAVETGIAGGSLAIFEGGAEIDVWEGLNAAAKSEETLANIEELLKRNDLDKNSIDKIAVSKGPGSYTGLRAGIALARGLQSALGCVCVGVSFLESMIFEEHPQKEIIACFGINRREVCWQVFKSDESGAKKNVGSPRVSKIKDFASERSGIENRVLIFFSNGLCRLSDLNLKSPPGEIVELKDAAAVYIGLKGINIFSEDEILPIYAREAGNL